MAANFNSCERPVNIQGKGPLGYLNLNLFGVLDTTVPGGSLVGPGKCVIAEETMGIGGVKTEEQMSIFQLFRQEPCVRCPMRITAIARLVEAKSPEMKKAYPNPPRI